MLPLYRINRFKIVDYLHDVWANDRKTEWSIWTVHSKIEIPHRYLRSGTDESSHRNSIGKMVASRKIPEDVIDFYHNAVSYMLGLQS